MSEISTIAAIRTRFPALSRKCVSNGRPLIYFDGPAGSQTPLSVADAVRDYLLSHNANSHGLFATSQETDEIVDSTRLALTDFFQTSDPDEIVFGANMTSLTLHVSRALARTWKPGDEVIVSQLDHDGNYTPWVLAARQAGAVLREIRVCPEDGTLDLEQYRSLLNSRTRLVAVGMASNALGTINPVAEIAAAARSVGALTYLDAVHFAPHRRIDLSAIPADFLVCSAYKFFGPHVGILWGRKELLESLQPDKLRPAPAAGPDRWMTGTQSFEGIAGVRAAIEYLGSLTEEAASLSLRERLTRSFAWIGEHETVLADQFLNLLTDLEEYRVWGISDRRKLQERVPTFSLTHRSRQPAEIAARLAQRGIFGWAGNHYALPCTTALALEPQGTLRLGMLHYNTREEIVRVVEELTMES